LDSDNGNLPAVAARKNQTVTDKRTDDRFQMLQYRNRSADRKITRVGMAMWLGAALLASSQSTFALAQPAAGGLETLADVRQALRRCWRWPPESVSSSGMELSVRLTFKRSGEIYGVRIAFQSQSSEASEEERAPYNTAVLESLRRCSPMPITEKLGEAIAGHVMVMHIHDKREF
jgi:hypothetical protein